MLKKTFGEHWKNHFSTIGLVGVNEALLNLFGRGIGTPEGLDFSIKILKYQYVINDKT
jgi:ribonucleoside-triphosphate reductase